MGWIHCVPAGLNVFCVMTPAALRRGTGRRNTNLMPSAHSPPRAATASQRAVAASSGMSGLLEVLRVKQRFVREVRDGAPGRFVEPPGELLRFPDEDVHDP